MTEKRYAWQGAASLSALLALSFGISFGSVWAGCSIGTRLWSICNVVLGLTQWAMPALVCVAGSLFLASKRQIKLSVLWRTYVPSALISCAVWWMASSAVSMYNNHPQELDLLTFRECMAETLEAPVFIGFCHMLVSFFILYPLLHRIIHDEKLTLYGMILIFAMSLLETTFRYIPYLSILSLFTDQLNWGFYRAWAFYLLFGAWIADHELRWETSLVIYVLGILATGAMIALTSATTKFSPGYANEYIGYTSPLTGIQTAAVVVFFNRQLKNRHAPVFAHATRNLWHCIPVLYVVSFFTDRLVSATNGSTIPTAVLSALANSAMGICIILAFGKLPGFKKLVGEYQHKGGIKSWENGV